MSAKTLITIRIDANSSNHHTSAETLLKDTGRKLSGYDLPANATHEVVVLEDGSLLLNSLTIWQPKRLQQAVNE